GFATLVSSPAPGATIPAGGSKFFTWTYSVTAYGNIWFSLTVYGQESGTAKVRATSQQVGVSSKTKAALAASEAAMPSSVFPGQPVVVTLTVTDPGGEAVMGLTSSMTVAGPGSVVLVSGPIPSVTVLAGGASQTMTWTYSTAGVGAVTFTGSVSG